MENEKIRLQKYLANQGVASRRAAEKMIEEGRVQVNDLVVDTMGTKIDPATDQVKADGQRIDKSPRMRYLLLYKPAGYISSAKDERGRRTVLDLIDKVEQRVYPVGRPGLSYLGIAAFDQ